MPRGPKKSASQHNNRHENGGIVAPGRRITKQKSNGQLKEALANGSATASDGSSQADTPPPAFSSTVPPLPDQSSFHSSSTTSNTITTATATATSTSTSISSVPISNSHANGRALPPFGKGRASSSANSSSNHQASLPPLHADARPDDMAGNPGRIGDAASLRRTESSTGRLSTTAQEAGAFHIAGTVLRSWPVADTLAVLVFLLSLPPALHSVINAVFTIATFVPPAGTFANLPTWSDLISSFSPTTPSLVVTALIDLAAMGLWVWLPSLCQALAIDSAQAIVATTLGGGYSNKPGSPDNTVLCLAFTMVTHLASRYASRYKHTVMHILHRSEIERWPPQNITVEERSLSHDYPVGYDRSWFDTIKVFLAIHIVCQGLTKMVRRSLSTPRPTTVAPLSSRNGDSETPNTSSTTLDTADGGSHHATHPSGLRSKESLANLRDANRDKVSSGKRRRKQGNYTRSQQPLWAAFAASKATIFQGIAENRASDDAKGTGAAGESELGDAPFESCRNNIWLTGIDTHSCFFETSSIDVGAKLARNDVGDSAHDKTTPFYVTVNGARWTSIKMEQVPTMEKPPGCWVGEIYGLSPACSYQLLFKSQHDASVLYEELIATPALTVSDKSTAAAVTAPPILIPSTPASPTATLETSIASFDTRITQSKEEQRRVRKEGRQTQQMLRREIDALNERISKQANNVQNLQAKQTRENQHIRQAEDAITTMAEELDTWKEIPDEDLDEYRDRKTEFESGRNAHRDAKNELVRAKEQNNRTLHTLHADANSVKQKNDRLQARVAKLTAQHSKLTDADSGSNGTSSGPTAGTGDASRSNSTASTTRAQQRAERQKKWDDQLEGRERMLHNMVLNYNSNVNHYRALVAQMEAAQAQAEPPRPITPEGDLPGTVPQPPSSTGNSRPLFDLPPRDPFATPDRFGGPATNVVNGGVFDPLTPGSVSLQKTNSTGGYSKTKPHSSSLSAVRPRSTSIMSGNTIYQDFDDGSGTTDVTSFDPWQSTNAITHFKRRSGGPGLVREGSNGGSSGSGSGSPLVSGGVIGAGAAFRAGNNNNNNNNNNSSSSSAMNQETTLWDRP